MGSCQPACSLACSLHPKHLPRTRSQPINRLHALVMPTEAYRCLHAGEGAAAAHSMRMKLSGEETPPSERSMPLLPETPTTASPVTGTSGRTSGSVTPSGSTSGASDYVPPALPPPGVSQPAAASVLLQQSAEGSNLHRSLCHSAAFLLSAMSRS